MSSSGNTITFKLTDATTVTLTLATADWPDAQQYLQSMNAIGGFYDNAGVWHPFTAIVSATIS